MNKLVCLCGIMSLAFFACEKKETPTSLEAMPVVTSAESVVTLIVSAGEYGEAQSEAGETYVKFLKWVPVDTQVTLLQGETRSTRVYDFDKAWRDVPLASARLEDGKKTLLAMHYILPNHRVVVVNAKEEATVYNGLEIGKISDFVLPRGTIIAVAPVEGRENQLNLFRFVAYQVPQRSGKKESFGTWSNFFVKSSDFSIEEKDLGVAKVLKNMDKINPSKWETTIEDASLAYAGSEFLDDARRKLAAAVGSEEDLQEESFSAAATVNAANVILRATPKAVSTDNIKRKLTQSQSVTITARTTGRVTIAGAANHWYHITTEDGQEGWVFGEYLSIEQ